MQDFVIGLFERAGGAAPGEGLDLRELLEAGVDRGNRQLRQQPRARAELLGLVARLRLGLGDYGEASMLLERQALLVDSLPRVPPGLRLESVMLRGQSHQLQSRPGDCVATMQPWLDEARRLQAQLPPQSAEFQSQLGRCRQALGERNVARQLFERSLALRNAAGDSAGAAQNLADLATLRLEAGDPGAALTGYSNALLRLRRDVGAQHPQEVDLLSGMAASRRALGEAAAAEAAQAQAVLLALELHGAQHPVTLRERRALAMLQVDAGQASEALHDLADAHRLLVDRFGPDHVEVAASHQAIALAERAAGRLDAALEAQARAVAIWRAAERPRLLAEALYLQAELLHAAGDDAGAMRTLDALRPLLAEISGATSPSGAQLARLYAEVSGQGAAETGR
jgi:serine/threonine-protein kinase